MDRADLVRAEPMVRVGGICGRTIQALHEARVLKDLRYSAGLLSLAAVKDFDEQALVAHCREVAQVLPIIGFYLQPAVGGRVLSYRFWRQFAEIENVVAIKIAPFNRYQTLDVVRAVAESEQDIALYTGNDDNILVDLVTPYVFKINGTVARDPNRGWSAGPLGCVDNRRSRITEGMPRGSGSEARQFRRWILQRNVEVTDCNAAFFDTANHFAGCIAGVHEVLRRQGLLEGIWCLNPDETLSPGQLAEIDRVYRAYPHLNDDDFVRAGLDSWLKP